MNKMKVLLLSASNYDFVDDQSKRQVKGTTLWLMPLQDNTDPYTNGNKPVKYSLKPEFEALFNSIQLPCFGEMVFNFDLSKNKVIPLSFDNFEVFEVGVNLA